MESMSSNCRLMDSNKAFAIGSFAKSGSIHYGRWLGDASLLAWLSQAFKASDMCIDVYVLRS